MLLLDEESLRKREKIWLALSELFLDTDVSLSYENIAHVCANSSFSLKELEEVLKIEVAPVCSKNLMSIAGEWAGFDKKWLFTNIKSNIRPRSFIYKIIFNPIKNFGFNLYIKKHWKEIKEIIIEKRKTS